MLPDVEGERAFGVGDLGDGHRGLILGGLQTALPLAAAFKQISEAEVELLALVQIVGGEVIGLKDRDELRIPDQSRVRTQVGGDFLRLILQNQSPLGLSEWLCARARSMAWSSVMRVAL